MPDSDDLLTTAQVAALLAVSARTVTRYAAAGRLVPVRLGRTVRYRSGEVMGLIGVRVARSEQWVPPAAGRAAEVTGGDTTGQVSSTGQPAADSGPDTTGHDTSGADSSGQDVSARVVELLAAELATLRADHAALQRELVEQAATAGLWQGRAHTLDAQLRQLTATAGQEPAQAAPGAPRDVDAPAPATPFRSLLQRIIAVMKPRA